MVLGLWPQTSQILHQLIVLVGVDLLHFEEDALGVEKLGVDLVRGFVVLADDEDLGGLVSRGGRFSGVDSLEELVQHPDDGRVVLGPEHFGHEGSVLWRGKKGRMKKN